MLLKPKTVCTCLTLLGDSPCVARNLSKLFDDAQMAQF
jgi:hypothetical protein